MPSRTKTYEEKIVGAEDKNNTTIEQEL